MDFHSLLTITHDLGRGFSIGSYMLRTYQLMFLAAFVGGFYIVKWMFKREGAPEAWMDSLLTYMVVSTVIGARLGHVFFYQWDYYQDNLIEILQVWKGGLASHGAAIAIIVAMVIFSKKVTKKNPLWILDRVVIVVALAGVLIRFGNYTNSEIYGKIGNSTMETVFLTPAKDYLENVYPEYIYEVDFEETNEVLETDSLVYPIYFAHFQLQDGIPREIFGQKLVNEILPRLSYRNIDDQNILGIPNENYVVDQNVAGVISIQVLGVPRYPTQLFESLGYLVIFIILFTIYLKTDKYRAQGYLLGLFLVLLFGFRFMIEYLKASQVSFEQGMALNMGQILSIPLVIAGLYLMISSSKRTY